MKTLFSAQILQYVGNNQSIKSRTHHTNPLDATAAVLTADRKLNETFAIIERSVDPQDAVYKRIF